MLHMVCIGRWRCNIQRRANNARYRAGRQDDTRRRNARSNARRLIVGRNYYGIASTPDAANALKAHIRQRRDAFLAAQRAERAPSAE